MEKYILAIDQGTTSSRAILFDKNAKIVDLAQKEFTQIFPKAGWVEHDPFEIWNTQSEVIINLIESANISSENIDSIGITNQRETTIIWDKNTGKPVYNALVWQDKRTTEICKHLKDQRHEEYIRNNTGLVIDSYFSATKIRWILDHIENGQARAENGDLLFGTVDTWLIYNMTEGRVHVTDLTNASRTMLFNIRTLEWDSQMLEVLNIPISMMPSVKQSSDHFGTYHLVDSEIPINGVGGDQQAALFGQLCWNSGQAKNTYGTGCFLLMNTGDELRISNYGLISTIACSLNNKVQYALEGSVFIAGAAIQWLRDGLQIIENSKESELKARSVQSSEGIYVVPAFTGLGAPHWDMSARGAIFGLTRGSNQDHIVRATLESIAYQATDILQAMELDADVEMKTLKVDGGATQNDFLMQFQSDILNVEIERAKVSEVTALGAAYLAGLYSGFYDVESLKDQEKDKFLPTMAEDERSAKYDKWKEAVKRTMNWDK